MKKQQLFILFLYPLLILSCITSTVSNRRIVDEVTEPSTSPSSISAQPRSRAYLSDLEDPNDLVPQSLREQLVLNWKEKLTKQTPLILISPAITQTRSEESAIARELYQQGIPYWIKPEIVALEISNQLGQRGLIRNQSSKMILKMRLKIYHTRNQKVDLDKTRTLTIESTRRRLPSQDINPRQFVLDDPDTVRDALWELLMDFQPDLIAYFQRSGWEGRIALIQGDRIYLNVGEQSGVRIGDILKVTEMGEEVYDPQSGKFIGRTSGKTKGTIEVISYFGDDGAIAIIHSGSGFRENDRVEHNW